MNAEQIIWAQECLLALGFFQLTSLIVVLIIFRDLYRKTDFLHWRLNNPPPREWDREPPTAAAPVAEVIEPGNEWRHGIRPDGSLVDESMDSYRRG